MMRPLRLGIIGLGYWAKNYIRILRQRDDVVLDAICDTDTEKLQYWQSVLGNTHAFTDAQDLCRHKLDGVLVVTPASTHYAMVRCALEHRLPVLVEKPLALSSRQAERLCILSEKYKVPLLVGHTYLFSQQVRYLADLAQRGAFGRISYIHSIRVNFGIVRSDCDVLWDLAPHDIAVLLYLLGEEPLEIRTWTASERDSSIADHAVIALQFAGDVRACVTVSWFWPEKIRKLTLIGTQGAAGFDDKGLESPLHLYSWRERTRNQCARSNDWYAGISHDKLFCPVREPLAEVIEQFISCIGGCNQCISDGAFALRVVKVLEKISRAAKKTGRQIVKLETKSNEQCPGFYDESLAHV